MVNINLWDLREVLNIGKKNCNAILLNAMHQETLFWICRQTTLYTYHTHWLSQVNNYPVNTVLLSSALNWREILEKDASSHSCYESVTRFSLAGPGSWVHTANNHVSPAFTRIHNSTGRNGKHVWTRNMEQCWSRIDMACGSMQIK